MTRQKYNITMTSGAFDIKGLVTEAVIENHLKVTYADEATYLDALCAAAWDRIEKHLNIQYGAGTINWEATDFGHTFSLPVDADRISNVAVTVWDGDGYEALTDVRTSNIGYPVCIDIDVDDAVMQTINPDGSTIRMKATADIAAATPPPAVQQAFLLYLGFLYEKREAVITGTIASELPRAYEYLLNAYRKGNIRF